MQATLQAAVVRGAARLPNTTTMRHFASRLSAFPHVQVRQTRWNDADGFGHVNNAVYYQYMDDAINVHLFERGIGADYPRFIVQNGIRYQRELPGFPAVVRVGLAVTKIGRSSVTYRVGFFSPNDDDTAAAVGTFVHVYMDDATGVPTKIPAPARTVLQEILVEDDSDEEQDDV